MYVGTSRVMTGCNLRILPNQEDQIPRICGMGPRKEIRAWLESYERTHSATHIHTVIHAVFCRRGTATKCYMYYRMNVRCRVGSLEVRVVSGFSNIKHASNAYSLGQQHTEIH